MNKFHYVYITTNLINGKQYVGEHSTNTLKNNYYGSGLYLKHAINEYGKLNFKLEILEFFDTKENAFNAQEKYINKYNTLIPNGYNISPKGGHNVKGCFSEESKYKIGAGNRGNSLIANNFGDRKGKNNGMYGKKHSKETIEKFKINNTKQNNPMYGKHLSNITKEKLRNLHLGKTHTEKTKQIIGEKNKGKKRTTEQKLNISIKLMGRKFSEETKKKMRKPKSKETKLKMSISQRNRWDNKNKLT